MKQQPKGLEEKMGKMPVAEGPPSKLVEPPDDATDGGNDEIAHNYHVMLSQGREIGEEGHAFLRAWHNRKSGDAKEGPYDGLGKDD